MELKKSVYKDPTTGKYKWTVTDPVDDSVLQEGVEDTPEEAEKVAESFQVLNG